MRMQDGVVSALRNGRVKASSEGDAKFAKDPEAGLVGLAWNGRVNGFVFRITIEDGDAPDIDRAGRDPLAGPSSVPPAFG